MIIYEYYQIRYEVTNPYLWCSKERQMVEITQATLLQVE